MKHLLFVLILLSSVASAQTPDTLVFAALKAPAVTTEERYPDPSPRNSSVASYIAPAVFLGYGFFALDNNLLRRVDRSVYNDMQEDHPGFRTTVDNYLQYSPLIATYALNMSGIKGKNKIVDQTALAFLSLAVAKGSAWALKDQIRQLRPNRASYSSFPSGHTTTAFAAAEIMNQEFGDRSVWYGVAAYSAATATGILRVYNNAHWFSNVIAGAGLGILSVKATYAVYPHLKNLLKKNTNVSMTPFYADRATGVSITARF